MKKILTASAVVIAILFWTGVGYLVHTNKKLTAELSSAKVEIAQLKVALLNSRELLEEMQVTLVNEMRKKPKVVVKHKTKTVVVERVVTETCSTLSPIVVDGRVYRAAFTVGRGPNGVQYKSSSVVQQYTPVAGLSLDRKLGPDNFLGLEASTNGQVSLRVGRDF
jgi:hypothetical protein